MCICHRNYIVLAMTDSLKEIIRVLQLTSPTEEEGELGGQQPGLPGGILPGTLAAKVHEAKTLLSKTGEYNSYTMAARSLRN